VRIGRLQIFNNWSPDLVADSGKVWLGLEYFCQEGDDLWRREDGAMIEFAAGELEKIGMIDSADVLDGTVVRVPKTYPAYFGAYEHFQHVREWLDGIANLYLVGRNGMHRYNNQDHSMLTAKLAVEAILDGSVDKAAIWAVNIDDDYHEELATDT
jgi:protoporphyrinogen oxidase